MSDSMTDSVSIDSITYWESADGTIFELPSVIANGSIFSKNADEEGPKPATRDDAIPFPSVFTKEMMQIISYLTQSSLDPILRIERPLKTHKLTDSGVPEWAAVFIGAVSLVDILDLADAAVAMQIKMLEYLCCARIASEVIKAGVQQISSIKQSPELDTATLAEKAAFARDVKSQNDWAWKDPDQPIIAENADSITTLTSGGGATASASASASASA